MPLPIYNPNSRYWDRELEEGLPDSRLRMRGTVMHKGQLMERCFCANCGGPGGLVTAEAFPHVFYICDECVANNGAPPGCIEVPETALRGQ
jgi:hypothetical protein